MASGLSIPRHGGPFYDKCVEIFKELEIITANILISCRIALNLILNYNMKVEK